MDSVGYEHRLVGGVGWVCVSAEHVCSISWVMSVILVFAKGEGKWCLWGVFAECVQCWLECRCDMSALRACRWLGCLPSRSPCVKCLVWPGRHEQRAWEAHCLRRSGSRETAVTAVTRAWRPGKERSWLPGADRGQCLEASNPVEYKWQGPMHHTDPVSQSRLIQSHSGQFRRRGALGEG